MSQLESLVTHRGARWAWERQNIVTNFGKSFWNSKKSDFFEFRVQ